MSVSCVKIGLLSSGQGEGHSEGLYNQNLTISDKYSILSVTVLVIIKFGCIRTQM